MSPVRAGRVKETPTISLLRQGYRRGRVCVKGRFVIEHYSPLKMSKFCV